MNFDKAKTQSRRIRRQRTWLFFYAFAVTGALIVSMRNNNDVEASMPKNIELSEMAPEEFADYGLLASDESLGVNDTAFLDGQATLLEESGEVSDALAQNTFSNGLHINEDLVEVAKGDSFIGILTNMGAGYNAATDIYTSFKKVYDARLLKAGQQLYIVSTFDEKADALSSIDKVMIEPVRGTRYIVERDADGKYESRVEKDDLTTDVRTVSGVIEGNLSSSMQAAGVPANIVGNFINIFSFSVDFRRDIRSGDSFEIRYEQMLAPDGKLVKNGEIIFAALQLGREKYELYRFEDNSGNVDYYDEQGLALKKNLDRKPMEFKKARISSRFGRRFHPILKVYKKHDGVDYAAPTGSKVYASGDGVVTMSKWHGGYGNYVKIRHNSEYSTAYGHLKSFAKGIRPGVRVKQGQLIAYVGNTGQSTGPHLHFEVIRNGKKVDPLKVKAATGQNLKGEKLTAFKKVVAEIKAGGAREKEIAAAETDEIGQAVKSLDSAGQSSKDI